MRCAHHQERIFFIFSTIPQYEGNISNIVIEGYDGKDKVFFCRCKEKFMPLIGEYIIFLGDSSFCLDSQLKYIQNMLDMN